MKTFSIDLSSDTKTKPSPEMREVMCQAEVGDEQIGEDPTVNKLLKMVCDQLGKEDALFLPTGTMCNQISMRVHCQPGDEIIGDESLHIRHYETGASAALSGALIYPINGKNGIFTSKQFEQAIRPPSNYHPKSAVVVIEQTSNKGGGTVWPLKYIQEITQIAKEHEIARHMDGARLFNAVVKEDISAKDYAKHFDSVWIDFTKGLGAPMGAVLAGTQEFIFKARRWKHQFGGAMRQAGIVAAAGIYALNNNIKRMPLDHSNAKLLAENLEKIAGISVKSAATNMVFFDVSGLNMSASEFNQLLEPHGLRFSDTDKYLLRAVTHLDVSTDQIHEALEIIQKAIT